MICKTCGKVMDDKDMYCGFCGAKRGSVPPKPADPAEPGTIDAKKDDSIATKTPPASPSAPSGAAAGSFFKSKAGRYVITGIACVVVWGIIYALAASQSDATTVAALVCAVFGWRALNRIQPSMFIIGNTNFWIGYFIIKGILSIAIGTFVTPFVIGKMIGGGIHDSIQ